MEILANCKLAKQNGEHFYDDEDLNVFELDTSPEDAIQFAFDHYRRIDGHIDWEDADFRAARKYMYNHLNYNDGVFDPRKREIVAVEHRFDITLEEPWAYYDYKLPDGKEISGQLSLKGTVDLVTKVDDDTKEIIDYKTGKYTKFPKDELKTDKDIHDDFQFQLYAYVIRKAFPDTKYVMLSVFYSQFNQPFTVDYSEQDDKVTLGRIRDKFERIKNDLRPSLNIGWWCRYVCPFAKPYKDTDKSICSYFKERVRTHGVDNTFVKYGDVDKLSQYGAGGGRTG